jgi:hypothetical protein
MRAFEVYLNGKRLCVAGIADDGVLTTIIDHVLGHGRNEQHVRIGGLNSTTGEHVIWKRKRLKTGDEVRVRIPPQTCREIDSGTLSAIIGNASSVFL